jgi:hypothetical protein
MRRALQAYPSALLISVWVVPMVAVAATAVAWALDMNHHPASDLLVGLVSAGIAALLFGLAALPFTRAEFANQSSYRELQERLAQIDARAGRAGPTTTAIHQLLERDGPQWIAGHGYIDCWRRVHRTEEALLATTDAADLSEEIAVDRLRLQGSTMPNQTELLRLLDDAGTALKDVPGPSPSPLPAVENATTVRFTIDEYRDTLWEGMARIRNRSMMALAVAGILGYLLLATALLYGQLGAMLASALLFFLVAAVVGLVNAIYTLSRTDSAVEDYGLANARLIGTPVLSGLSGLGGVLLVALWTGLSGALATVSTVSAARMEQPVVVPALSDILDATAHPVYLVVAALFGLTPALFLGRLNALVQQFNLGVASTEPGGGGPAAGP